MKRNAAVFASLVWAVGVTHSTGSAAASVAAGWHALPIIHAGIVAQVGDRSPDLRPRDPGPTSDPGPMPEPRPAPAPGNETGSGDAEPAPSATPPTGTTQRGVPAGRTLPRRRLALMPRFAYRLGEAGRAITPAPGYGLGGTIEVDYARLGDHLQVAAGVDFSFDRFATGEQGTVTVDGTAEAFGSTRVVSETSFVVVHTAAATLGRVRPYFTLGGGVGLGYFDSAAADLRPGTAHGAHFLGRASLGIDVTLGYAWGASIRVDYTAVRGTSSFVTEMGRRLPLFGDLFDLGAGAFYRF